MHAELEAIAAELERKADDIDCADFAREQRRAALLRAAEIIRYQIECEA